MLHDQMINFLETAIIFLLLTNAVSGLAAAYAISLAQRVRAVPVVVARGTNGARAGLSSNR
jgi:hypothetical protein